MIAHMISERQTQTLAKLRPEERAAQFRENVIQQFKFEASSQTCSHIKAVVDEVYKEAKAKKEKRHKQKRSRSKSKKKNLTFLKRMLALSRLQVKS